MISVRGTQTGTDTADPAAPYARKPVERSGAIAKASLLFVSVVIWLKAVTAGAAQSEEGPAEARPEPASEPVAAAPKMMVLTGGKPQERGERGHDGRGSDDVVPAAFDFTAGPDTIAFPTVGRQLISPVFQPAGYVGAQANVNGPLGSGGGVPGGPAAAAGGAGHGMGPIGVLPGVRPAGPPAPAPAPVTPPSGGPDDGAGGAGDEDDEDDVGTPGLPGNRAPRLTGPVYLNDVSGCAVLAIGLAELLRGATDPDGDALSVTTLASSAGTLEMTAAGTWAFSPEGAVGPVTITYRVSDGSLEVDQTLHFSVVPAMAIVGSDGNDILIGTMGDDEIAAGAGDDLIDARAGDDIVYGGDGDDHILAGSGNDRVYGGAGGDVIFGGAGDDEIHGGDGNDRLFGEAGDDTLLGGAGDDMLDGGDGDDTLEGGDGDDHLFGGDGADLVSGGQGADRIEGGDGDDTLFGDAGDDVILGGDGRDLIVAGSGNDEADGGDGDDRILGGDGDDALRGGAGNDVLLGEAGDDVLDGGAGEDAVLAGAGNDHVIAAADGADDHYDGGEGSDLLDYSAAEEDLEIDLVAGHVHGIEVGNDTIAGFERIAAGAGDDLIRFGGTPVSMSGGEGCNTFEFVTPADLPASSPVEARQVSYEIEDFKVGDRVRMSKWEIFEEVFDEFEDRFERLYGDDIDEDRVPIRYQNEWTEDMNETIIEADLDGDDFYETAIVLYGRHALVLFETA